MDKLLEINPNAIDSKTVEDKGGQKLPDDGNRRPVAKLAAASLRTTEPEVKNLTSIKTVNRSAAYRWIA